MKKSKLLSLLTAAAIVITTGATYAVWDSVTDDTTATVTFRKPVTVTVGDSYTLTATGNDTLGSDPQASGTVNFTVSNEDNLADTLTIVPEVSGTGSATADDFEFVIEDTGNSNTPLSGNVSAGFVDKTLDSTNYTITVTPKASAASKVDGQAISIKLTATLSKSI